ncbi:MAG TPA: PAS domain S-box protein [Aggregatilineaceae bacterium]|nr:PAS domain S-box protein [Aggregatilineaceae bacterium]
MSSELQMAYWRRLWKHLTCPSTHIQRDEQRRLLSLLFFALFVTASVISPIWIVTTSDGAAISYSAVAVVVTLGLAYALSRTRFYRLGIMIVLLSFVLIVVSTFWASAGSTAERLLILNLISISVITSRLWGQTRVQLIVYGVGLGILGIFLLLPDRLVAFTYSYLFFLLFMAGLDYLKIPLKENNQHQQMEEVLRQSEARIKMTVQGMLAGTWEWNILTGETIFNERWAEIIGYTLDELAPISIQTWNTLVHPDDLQISSFFLEKHFVAETAHYDCEVRMKHKDGHWVWVWDRGMVTEWTKDGKPLRMFGTHIDITKRKQIEEELRHSEERNRAIVMALPDMIFYQDRKGTYLDIKPGEGIMLYKQPDEVIGRTVSEILPPDLAEQALKRLQVALETGTVQTSEYTLPFGEENFYFEARSVVSGKNEILTITRDITDRKRGEMLMRIQRDLALALSSVSSLTDILHHVLTAAVQIEGIDCGGVYLVDQETGDMNLITHIGLSAEFVKSSSHFKAIDPHTQMAMTGMPSYQSFVNRGLESQGNLHHQAGLCALVIIPVRFEDQVIAVLNLASHTHNEIPLNTRFALEEIAAKLGSVVARVRVETALRESEQNLQALFETIDDFLFVADSSGNILQVNPVVLRRLGYSAEEIVQKTILDMHPPQQRGKVQSIVNAMFQGETSLCTVPLITRDGTLIPVETRVTLGRWSGHKMLFGISRDVTEQRRSENALRESEERQRALLSAIPDLMFRNNRDGTYLDYYAPNAEDLFVSPAEFLNHKPTDFLPPENAAAHLQIIEQVLTTGKEVVYEYSLPIGDGTKNFEARTVRAGSNEVLTIVRNVTERKKLQEKTLALMGEKERRQILSSFIQNASHELRTPLAVIKSNIYLLRNVSDEEKRQLYIERIDLQANRLIRMLDMVLTMTKLDSDTVFNFQPVDVNTMIQRITLLAQGLLIEKSIEFHFNPDPNLLNLYADEFWLQEALVRLFDNALRYTPNGQSIEIRTHLDDTHAVIEIIDTGIGIHEDAIPHIFERFWRIDEAHSTPGFGLGLPIVQRIIQQHHGTIEVESSLGKGSVFRILLPMNTSPSR